MNIKYFATTWGLETLNYESRFKKIKEAGYDGVETGRVKSSEINQVRELLEKYELLLICQQWSEGNNADEHIESFIKQAELNSRLRPISINSHTGKDHFEFSENVKILQATLNFENSGEIAISHETHRGRFAFASHVTSSFLNALPKLKLTADFSHWCCVAESYLEDQENHLEKAMNNCVHIHARIGNTQSSQINDPRSSEWAREKEIFLNWWKNILDKKISATDIMPVTCEFGPHPYMPTEPFTAAPLASQWDINLFMKDFLKQRFG